MGKKNSSVFFLVQLQMVMPILLQEAEALNKAVDAFKAGLPIGDGIGPMIVGKMMLNKEKKIQIINPVIGKMLQIDNASKFPSRTTALNLGSIDLFSQLGLWNSLQDLATDFNKIYVWDKEGSSRLEFSAKDIDREKLGSIIANNYIYGEISKILEERLIIFSKSSTS